MIKSVANFLKSFENVRRTSSKGDTCSSASRFSEALFTEKMGASYTNIPAAGISEEAWIDSIFTAHNALRLQTDCSGVYISLILDISKVKWYLSLQRKLSQIIPEEAKRPTIYLSMVTQPDEPKLAAKGLLLQSSPSSATQSIEFFPHNKSADDCCVAILGGMGPVSDAELLCGICELIALQKKHQAPRKHTVIRLLSAPPPRKVWDIAWRSLPYLSSLMSFFRDVGQAPIFLASNTSHVYFPYFRALAGTGLQNLTTAVVRDCSEHNGQEIKDKDKRSLPESPSCVLIIGTSLAASYRLYEQCLEAVGVPSVSLTLAEQQLVQSNIDKVKSGVLLDNGEQLFNIIKSAIIAYNSRVPQGGHLITVILLGCTELPLALGRKVEIIAHETGARIVNSEEVFRDEIYRHVV